MPDPLENRSQEYVQPSSGDVRDNPKAHVDDLCDRIKNFDLQSAPNLDSLLDCYQQVMKSPDKMASVNSEMNQSPACIVLFNLQNFYQRQGCITIKGQTYPTLRVGEHTFAFMIDKKYDFQVLQVRGTLQYELDEDMDENALSTKVARAFVDCARLNKVDDRFPFFRIWRDIENDIIQMELNGLLKIISDAAVSGETITRIFSPVLSEDFKTKSIQEQYYQLRQVRDSLLEQFQLTPDRSSPTYYDRVEETFSIAVLQELTVLKKHQNSLKSDRIIPLLDKDLSTALPSKTQNLTSNKPQVTSDESDTVGVEYHARVHNDAQQLILYLFRQAHLGVTLGEKRKQPRDFYILNKDFNLTDFLDEYEDDLKYLFSESEQEKFDAYRAAFKEAFARYYKEILTHAKKIGEHKRSGPCFIIHPLPKNRNAPKTGREFEFSFQRNPQKENIAVIDRQIKEMVSEYQTAFFILGDAKFNQKSIKDLEEQFKKDMDSLLGEREACLNAELTQEQKEEIPPAPVYHVIISSKKVLEVNVKNEQRVQEKLLEWINERHLKQIFSLKNIRNFLIMLHRVSKRHISMVTSAHHATLIFNGTISSHNVHSEAIRKAYHDLQCPNNPTLYGTKNTCRIQRNNRK